MQITETSASWGDSDSNVEEMNTKCLMVDDEVKDIPLRQSVLLSTVKHLKYIIDDQREQIEFIKAIIKNDEERIDDLKEEKYDVVEKIDTLRKVALTNRDLANAQEAEANAHETKKNLFLIELKNL